MCNVDIAGATKVAAGQVMAALNAAELATMAAPVAVASPSLGHGAMVPGDRL